jgi:hypothetical protein
VKGILFPAKSGCLGFFLILCSLAIHAQGDYEVFESKFKVGLRSSDGKTLIPAKYDRLGWSDEDVLPLGEVIGYFDKSWGLISVKGKKITAPRYYSLKAIHKDLIIASQIGRFSNELLYGALNTKGETVLDFKYHSVNLAGKDLIVSERKRGASYYGLLNAQNMPVLPLKYRSVCHLQSDLFVFEEMDGRLGIVRNDGLKLISASLDSLAPISTSKYVVFQSGRQGVMDSTARILLRPEFKWVNEELDTKPFDNIELRSAQEIVGIYDADSLAVTQNGFTLVFRNGFAEILNSDDRVLSRQKHLYSFESFRENIIVRAKHGVEVFNTRGEHCPGNSFQDVRFDQHHLYAKSKDGWQVYNAFGSKISNRYFEDVLPNSNNLIPVKRKDYWGYLDFSGETAISFRFEQASVFQQELAAVEYVGYKMLINQFGEQVGEASYDDIAVQPNNTAIVRARSRTDLISAQGSAIFQTYNKLIPNRVGYLERTADGDVGLIAKNGRIIFHPRFSHISDLTNRQFLTVKSSEGAGLSFLDGAWLIPPTLDFEEISGNQEGHSAIKKNGQWGFVNRYAQLVIANRYDSVRSFSDDLAAVMLGEKWGFIDKQEKIVIQPNLDSVEDFAGGLSIVSRGGKYGLLNSNGKYVLGIEYDSLAHFGDQLFMAKNEDKVGVFDKNGGQILPVSYSSVESAKDGMIVQRRGQFGLVDHDGQYIIPLRYNRISEVKEGIYACYKPGSG